MKLLATAAAPINHAHEDSGGDAHSHGHGSSGHGNEAGGIEWEDEMIEVKSADDSGEHALEADRLTVDP